MRMLLWILAWRCLFCVADGVALGAAATTSQAHVEMIVFIAIMLHKVSVIWLLCVLSFRPIWVFFTCNMLSKVCCTLLCYYSPGAGGFRTGIVSATRGIGPNTYTQAPASVRGGRASTGDHHIFLLKPSQCRRCNWTVSLCFLCLLHKILCTCMSQ